MSLNNAKMLFQAKDTPVDLTTLFDSTESHKKQLCLVFISDLLPTFAQGRQTLCSWLQEKKWKFNNFNMRMCIF